MNIFQSIFLATALNVCWNPQNRALFSKMIDLSGHMPMFTLKNKCFPIYLLENPKTLCWNPQKRDHFSQMINLRGHMPTFTCKMIIFPSISLTTPEFCVETLRRGITFPRWSIWVFTCLHLLEKWMFSNLSSWQLHKCVLKSSEQGLSFQDDQFEGSHA